MWSHCKKRLPLGSPVRRTVRSLRELFLALLFLKILSRETGRKKADACMKNLCWLKRVFFFCQAMTHLCHGHTYTRDFSNARN